MSGLPFTLRQLDVFASLCATRSFRGSAENLRISQASVSNQMKSLEHQLGVSLFERRPGRRPTLTREGIAFADDLLAFQQAARRLASHSRRMGDRSEQAVRFRVMVGQGLLDNFIRAKLDRFFAENPQIEIVFEARAPTAGPIRELRKRYDFVLTHVRANQPLEPGFRVLALVRGGIYGHRDFAEGHTLPLAPAMLNALPFIMPLAASDDEREVLRQFERFGIRPHRVVGHTQYYDVMAAMLERGIGVASFADTVLPPAMRETVVILHPLENWQLIWFRKDASIDPRRDAVQNFLWSSVLRDENYRTLTVFTDKL